MGKALNSRKRAAGAGGGLRNSKKKTGKKSRPPSPREEGKIKKMLKKDTAMRGVRVKVTSSKGKKKTKKKTETGGTKKRSTPPLSPTSSVPSPPSVHSAQSSSGAKHDRSTPTKFGTAIRPDDGAACEDENDGNRMNSAPSSGNAPPNYPPGCQVDAIRDVASQVMHEFSKELKYTMAENIREIVKTELNQIHPGQRGDRHHVGALGGRGGSAFASSQPPAPSSSGFYGVPQQRRFRGGSSERPPPLLEFNNIKQFVEDARGFIAAQLTGNDQDRLEGFSSHGGPIHRRFRSHRGSAHSGGSFHPQTESHRVWDGHACTPHGQHHAHRVGGGFAYDPNSQHHAHRVGGGFAYEPNSHHHAHRVGGGFAYEPDSQHSTVIPEKENAHGHGPSEHRRHAPHHRSSHNSASDQENRSSPKGPNTPEAGLEESKTSVESKTDEATGDVDDMGDTMEVPGGMPGAEQTDQSRVEVANAEQQTDAAEASKKKAGRKVKKRRKKMAEKLAEKEVLLNAKIERLRKQAIENHYVRIQQTKSEEGKEEDDVDHSARSRHWLNQGKWAHMLSAALNLDETDPKKEAGISFGEAALQKHSRSRNVPVEPVASVLKTVHPWSKRSLEQRIQAKMKKNKEGHARHSVDPGLYNLRPSLQEPMAKSILMDRCLKSLGVMSIEDTETGKRRKALRIPTGFVDETAALEKEIKRNIALPFSKRIVDLIYSNLSPLLDGAKGEEKLKNAIGDIKFVWLQLEVDEQCIPVGASKIKWFDVLITKEARKSKGGTVKAKKKSTIKRASISSSRRATVSGSRAAVTKRKASVSGRRTSTLMQARTTKKATGAKGPKKSGPENVGPVLVPYDANGKCKFPTVQRTVLHSKTSKKVGQKFFLRFQLAHIESFAHEMHKIASLMGDPPMN